MSGAWTALVDGDRRWQGRGIIFVTVEAAEANGVSGWQVAPWAAARLQEELERRWEIVASVEAISWREDHARRAYEVLVKSDRLRPPREGAVVPVVAQFSTSGASMSNNPTFWAREGVWFEPRGRPFGG